MKLFQWHFGLYLIPLVFLLPTSNAQAAPNITCLAAVNTAAGGTGVINLGTITPDNVDNASIPATLSYECKNTGSNGYVSVCLAVDGGSYTSDSVNPRYLSQNGTNNPANPRLAFNMRFVDGGDIWSTYNKAGSVYNSKSMKIARDENIIGDIKINVSLLPNQGNNLATWGTYINDFNGAHTALTIKTRENSSAPNCDVRSQDEKRFPFKVQATLIPSCEITTNPGTIYLGSKPASERHLSSNGKIGITCTKDALYKIGLAPKTPDPYRDNNSGAGLMSGTDNIPTVPYQLYSAPGPDGTKWGNNGSTFANLTNGVNGRSDGSEQSHTVYVTVPSADFKPDTYSDTVTIHVNY